MGGRARRTGAGGGGRGRETRAGTGAGRTGEGITREATHWPLTGRTDGRTPIGVG